MKLKKNSFSKFKNYILKNFLEVQGVISVNLVGSFWNNPNENNFRDIDIVIILNNIDKKIPVMYKFKLTFRFSELSNFKLSISIIKLLYNKGSHYRMQKNAY